MALWAPGNRSGQNRQEMTPIGKAAVTCAKITQNQILGAIFGDKG
jgi:hypothetical protein